MIVNNGSTSSSDTNSIIFATNDIIGLEIDFDAGTAYAYHNGILVSSIVSIGAFSSECTPYYRATTAASSVTLRLIESEFSYHTDLSYLAWA